MKLRGEERWLSTELDALIYAFAKDRERGRFLVESLGLARAAAADGDDTEQIRGRRLHRQGVGAAAK
jgi:hypothetical protein